MLIKKPPIVVVLGHIDHGKTTLLDYIRKTNVALKEAGGITQKIGAYEIEFDKEKITFIDTPGHSAFNNLRQRGVKVADIGILVIAADDGVKEQTKESLEYLKSANLPFIVALNKIDKKEADPQRVISQLVELDVIPEKWGGQVPLVEISAKTGQGVDELLETIILLRDIYDLKVETEKPGSGFILESIKDPKRGILASAILTEGKINYGDILITPTTFAKIKIFEDDLGQKIKQAFPSKPFLVGNFEDLPLVGEEFQIGTEEKIKEIQKELKEKETEILKRVVIYALPEKETYDYLLIIKADHIGSLEALENIFSKLAKENNLNLKIIKADLGPVSFEDVKLAKDFNAFLISFNLKNQRQILEEVQNLNINFLEANVIYEIEEKFLKYLKGEKEEIAKGELQVLATFSKTRTKKTIGGRVIKGKIRLGQRVIIIRGEETVGQGKIISLEKNKVPAEEVNEGELCGLIIETTKDIFENDIIKV
jgi:translation initiation factor IF-2